MPVVQMIRSKPAMTTSNAFTDKPMTKRRLFRWMGASAIGIGVALLLMGWWLWPLLVRMGWPTVGVGLAWLLLSPWMSKEPMRPAGLRYLRTLLLAMGGYFAALCVVSLSRGLAMPTWAMGLLAMLPVLPMAWVMFAMWRVTRDSDELERRIVLEAAFITGGVVGLLTFAVGMLQIVDVLHAGKWLFLILPLMFLVFGVTTWWVRRKYGLQGIC